MKSRVQPAPNVAVDSSTDTIGDLNDKFNGAQWVVVNLASLQSIPLSDFSHSPYGQDSHYLETYSARSNSANNRATAAAAAAAVAAAAAAGGGALRKDGPVSPRAFPAPRSPPRRWSLPDEAGPAGEPPRPASTTRRERESVTEVLVEREVGKRPALLSPKPTPVELPAPRRNGAAPPPLSAVKPLPVPTDGAESPVFADSIRELTNARRTGLSLSASGTAQHVTDEEPSLSTPGTGSTDGGGFRRSHPPWRSAVPRAPSRQASRPNSARNAAAVAPAVNHSGADDTAAATAVTSLDDTPVKRRSSRRKVSETPPADVSTAAPSPKAAVRGGGGGERAKRLSISTASERRRTPLCAPLPPTPPALREEQLFRTPPPTPTPTARQRAATASQEHLLRFVRSVADPEVLHVIHDYLREGRAGRPFAEATRVCGELLQQKEQLLPGRGSGRRHVQGRQRGGPHAILPEGDWGNASGDSHDDDDDDEEDDEDDEFDDLNTNGTAFPQSAPTPFRFGEPSVQGVASRVFHEGLLFRVKDRGGNYHFYNDTPSDVMMVRAQCALQGGEEINDRAIVTPLEGGDGRVEITIAVLPEETNFFMGQCRRLPRIMARAVPAPDSFTAPSVARFTAAMNADINRVRASLGKWSKATDQRAYIKCCLRHRLRFTDLDFRPCARSLCRPGEDIVRVPTVAWRRPEEYLPLTEVSEARLFRGEVSCHLVRQGELNDHTVVAAIAALAQYPHHVMWLFRHPVSGEQGKRERALGCYRVTLLQGGWWTTLVVDSYVPATARGPLFARDPLDPRRLWVPLLEKAYAKAHGSYAALCLVDVFDALTDLTGFPARSVGRLWAKARPDAAGAASVKLFRYLQRCVASGYLVLLHTPAADDERAADTVALARQRSTRLLPVGEADADGAAEEPPAGPPFIPGHVYFLSDAAHYKELDLRMVRIKNPWTWEAAGGPAAGAKRSRYRGWYEKPDESFTSAMVQNAGGAAAAAPTSQRVRRLQAAAKASGRVWDLGAADEAERRKGTMWLEWAEALRAFAGGGVCYTLWRHEHYRVRNNFGSGRPDFVVEVGAVARRTELFLTLTVERVGPASGPSCGVSLTVTRHRRGAGGEGEEEVWFQSCEDLECVATATTYVRDRMVSARVVLEPGAAPYHIIPRIDPDDASVQRRAGEAQVPFVIGLFSSAAVGADDGVDIRFKRIPRTCAVFEDDAKHFTLSPSSCADFTATYQCCCPGGVSTKMGTHIEPDS